MFYTANVLRYGTYCKKILKLGYKIYSRVLYIYIKILFVGHREENLLSLQWAINQCCLDKQCQWLRVPHGTHSHTYHMEHIHTYHKEHVHTSHGTHTHISHGTRTHITRNTYTHHTEHIHTYHTGHIHTYHTEHIHTSH